MNTIRRYVTLLIGFQFLLMAGGFVTNANAQNIASGYWHTLSLCTDGTVSAWGNNFYGELGNGTTLNSTSPIAVPGLTDVIEVGCGGNFSMALKSDSTLWVWGFNQYGQLGNGTQTNSPIPIQVPGLTGVKAMDGAVHCIVLKGDSTVWTWGYNAWGQMGNGASSNTPTLSPIQVVGLSGIISVEASHERSMALKNDSTVWMWGTGFYGGLGNGFNLSSFTPIQVAGLTGVVDITTCDLNSYALKADGTVWAWGWNEVGAIGDGTYTDAYYPVQVPGLSDIISIEDGGNFAVFLKNDGTVWTVGYNNFGQLGIGSSIANSNTVVQVTDLSDVVAIEAGSYQSFATKSDGTVWAWGSNNQGQLGIDLPIYVNAPIEVMGICSEMINVENEKANESILLYPNPTSEHLSLRTPVNASGPMERITITDSSGRIVWQSSQVSPNFSVDVSQYAEGLYFLSVQYEASTAVQTFVVAK